MVVPNNVVLSEWSKMFAEEALNGALNGGERGGWSPYDSVAVYWQTGDTMYYTAGCEAKALSKDGLPGPHYDVGTTETIKAPGGGLETAKCNRVRCIGMACSCSAHSQCIGCTSCQGVASPLHDTDDILRARCKVGLDSRSWHASWRRTSRCTSWRARSLTAGSSNVRAAQPSGPS